MFSPSIPQLLVLAFILLTTPVVTGAANFSASCSGISYNAQTTELRARECKKHGKTSASNVKITLNNCLKNNCGAIAVGAGFASSLAIEQG
jgi:hypothetical protein